MNSPLGPRTVSFEETADRMEKKLEEMTTIGNVEVRRYMYPSSTSGGWGKQQSSDDTYGGYEWRIRFLENPGSTDGLTYPPGSGDVDGISTTYSGTLNGNSAKTTTEMIDGSYPISGEFTVKYAGYQTDYLDSDAMYTEVETRLEELAIIGDVTIEDRSYLMDLIPGVTATVHRDRKSIELIYDTDVFEHVDLMNYMVEGNMIRIGGGVYAENSTTYSYTGASYLDEMVVYSGSPIFETSSDLSSDPIILPGQSIEIGSNDYEIRKTGVEVQQLVISCAQGVISCSQAEFALSFVHNLVEETTSCLSFNASIVDLQEALEGFSTITEGDLMITKEGTGNQTEPFIFKIYFHGTSVFGNVAPLTVTSIDASSTSCTSASSLSVVAHTLIQ
jgi:hypothetical protein